jgi:hypothetical protein
MADDLRAKQDELARIEEELKSTGLSRRRFLNRLSAAGFGFGAAFTLNSRNAGAHEGREASVKVGSSNSAVNNVLPSANEGETGAPVQGQDGGDRKRQIAQYVRFYNRYARAYYRYARVYDRIYVRF